MPVLTIKCHPDLATEENETVEVLYDECDHDFVMANKWVHTPTGYVRIRSGKKGMHNLFMQPDKGLVVHHINMHKLDNRRENLRVMTTSEHMSLHHPYDGGPTARRTFRMSNEDWAELGKLAAAAGMTITAFIIYKTVGQFQEQS